MISGAGRLATGAMQLVLLAFGIVAGAQLVGVPATSISETAAQPLGQLAPWVGVAIFGLGVMLNSCARPASMGWIVLVLYVAFAGQVVGGLLFGGVLSAFFGALAMAPVAMFAATRGDGPPTLVSFPPAFWLLVPGALSLVGVTKVLGDERVEGVLSLVTAATTMVTIALGRCSASGSDQLSPSVSTTRGQGCRPSHSSSAMTSHQPTHSSRSKR